MGERFNSLGDSPSTNEMHQDSGTLPHSRQHLSPNLLVDQCLYASRIEAARHTPRHLLSLDFHKNASIHAISNGPVAYALNARVVYGGWC